MLYTSIVPVQIFNSFILIRVNKKVLPLHNLPLPPQKKISGWLRAWPKPSIVHKYLDVLLMTSCDCHVVWITPIRSEKHLPTFSKIWDGDYFPANVY